MNSGLPSLLDAIFGKQDLASVSLDEMYDVVNEFPSFNAAHFLLAKKLREQKDPSFEKESMRTALYFNNPFWLQALLDEGYDLNQFDRISHVKETGPDDKDAFLEYSTKPHTEIEGVHDTPEDKTPEQSTFLTDELDKEEEKILDEKNDTVLPAFLTGELDKEEEKISGEKNDTVLPAFLTDDLDKDEEDILDEKIVSDDQARDSFQYAEPGPETVKSFDELMAKYNIEPLNMVDETPVEIQEDTQHKNPEMETVHGSGADLFVASNADSYSEKPKQEINELKQDPGSTNDEVKFESIADTDNDEFETREEIVNEYGIFEEVVIKKRDHDMDAFDRPFDQIPQVSEKTDEPIIIIPVENLQVVENTLIDENSSIVENQSVEDAPDKTDEHDYDDFDRPIENDELEIYSEPAPAEENFTVQSIHEADNTDDPDIHHEETETRQNGEMQVLSDRFEEQQKSLAAFNVKNADSIVFTPYHMVDYFASQGIKLVLEDNPPDQFGKQLKSFTDWLKVMKKLPVKPSSEKTDEKEADQIRHFASHSIEERDVLTESMAEVLAKQGMYENAISLYQKLSLIYPPKSAYFASRIEQLKASLP
jgi:hypothetical protein